MNDPKKLDELEALEKAATPGPWETSPWPNGTFAITGYGDCLIADVHEAIPDELGEDHTFIAALRNAAPELLKAAREVEQLRRKVTVHIGTSTLSKDLVWCECGRGLSLTGKWGYCPSCGHPIDQQSYSDACELARENGATLYRNEAEVDLMREVEQLRRDRERLLNVARGCKDYGGGYRSHESLLEAFHHGIQTVVQALEAAAKNPAEFQVRVLEGIGDDAAMKGGEYCGTCNGTGRGPLGGKGGCGACGGNGRLGGAAIKGGECEWNPITDSPATDCAGRHSGCQNEALVCVGSKITWHLCACCAMLPQFRKFRKRVPLPLRKATEGK